MFDLQKFIEIQRGDKIRHGDVMRDGDKVLTMDNTGKLLGVQCIGCEVHRNGTWYRPKEEQPIRVTMFNLMSRAKLEPVPQGQPIKAGDLLQLESGDWHTIDPYGRVLGYPAENLVVGRPSPRWYRNPDGPVLDVLHNYSTPESLVKAAAEALQWVINKGGYTTGHSVSNELTEDDIHIVNAAGALLAMEGFPMEKLGLMDISAFSPRDQGKIKFLQTFYDEGVSDLDYFGCGHWANDICDMLDEIATKYYLGHHDYRDWRNFAKGMTTWLSVHGYPQEEDLTDEDVDDRLDEDGVNKVTWLWEEDRSDKEDTNG